MNVESFVHFSVRTLTPVSLGIIINKYDIIISLVNNFLWCYLLVYMLARSFTGDDSEVIKSRTWIMGEGLAELEPLAPVSADST